MSRPKGSKNKPKPNSNDKVEVKTVVIEGTGEEMPQLMKDAGVKLPLPETGYDGVKMIVNHQDEITDRIAPYVQKLTEAKAKLHTLGGEKAATEAAVKLVKSKPTLSPFMLARQKAKGGGI